MPASRCFPHEVRTLGRISSNHKKSGAGTVFSKQVEQLRRYGWIWPIIKCNRQLARRVRMTKRLPKKLRSRVNGAIGGKPSTCRGHRRTHGNKRIHGHDCRTRQDSAATIGAGHRRSLISHTTLRPCFQRSSMKCSVCDQEYGVTHVCAGVPPVPPLSDIKAPRGFALWHYVQEAYRIASWDDDAIMVKYTEVLAQLPSLQKYFKRWTESGLSPPFCFVRP